MAKPLNWARERQRQQLKKLVPLTLEQRKQRARKNHWDSQTWALLRARTQALADAAAPKFDDQPDDGKVPW